MLNRKIIYSDKVNMILFILLDAAEYELVQSPEKTVITTVTLITRMKMCMRLWTKCLNIK